MSPFPLAVGTCAIAPNAKMANGQVMDPTNWGNSYGFYSHHAQGLHFCLADGSVRFIHEAIDLQVYRALATIQGGEAAACPP